MAVKRIDLNRCIGCGACVKVCPLDVMRLDRANGKSVIAYIENCQSCGQCYLHCPTESIGIDPATNLYGPSVCAR